MRTNYEIGEVVRIREWDDMATAYPERDCDDAIMVGAGVTHKMKPLCGTDVTIVDKYTDEEGTFYKVKDDKTVYEFDFSAEMFE